MKVAIGLGASLGDRRATLEGVLCKLDAMPGMRLLRGSRWYRSPPLRGGTARNWFLNGVATFEVDRTIEEILAICQQLEARAGRRRARFWGDRPLDLDLLLADGVVRQDPALTLPHPAIADRSFVLLPLLEVWPDAVDAAGKPWRDRPIPGGPRPWPVGVVAVRRPPV